MHNCYHTWGKKELPVQVYRTGSFVKLEFTDISSTSMQEKQTCIAHLDTLSIILLLAPWLGIGHMHTLFTQFNEFGCLYKAAQCWQLFVTSHDHVV